MEALNKANGISLNLIIFFSPSIRKYFIAQKNRNIASKMQLQFPKHVSRFYYG